VKRLRANEGFGLVELLIAMTVLNVALLTLIASFSSGAVALTRASKNATAASLADAQVELYRAMTYDSIGLVVGAVNGTATDAVYKADTACIGGGGCTNIEPTAPDCATITGSGGTQWNIPNACNPSRSISGTTNPASPDKLSYRVDTYIRILTVANQRDTKEVTVVVRDGATLSKTLARVVSIFDCSSGQGATGGVC
jgi:type II secretory pathway pseudopilin PulG